jgi:hypothetical protein
MGRDVFGVVIGPGNVSGQAENSGVGFGLRHEDSRGKAPTTTLDSGC